MPSSESISLERLDEERFGKVLCYPEYDLEEFRSRLDELRCLGVKSVKFAGKKHVWNIPVIGKGSVGIVVSAQTDAGQTILKIRRVDACRDGMHHEAELLRMANAIGVGPRLYNVTKNFLVMELFSGELLPQWIEALNGEEKRSRICRVLGVILEQCYLLDIIGLDHGELSRAPKHIIVDATDSPHLVDFEAASINRRPANVSSICHYLFLGSQFAKRIQIELGKIDRRELTSVLRQYKRRYTRETLDEIFKLCRLGYINDPGRTCTSFLRGKNTGL